MQTSAWAPRTVEDSVLAALMSIGREMRQRMSMDALEPGTFWVLHSLHCRGASRVTDLAARSDLDASTVSRHVQQLSRAGLVERAPDPGDRRALMVKISTAGVRVITDSLEQRKDVLRSRLSGWSPADVETLDRLLTRLADRTPLSTPVPDVAPGHLSDQTPELESA